MFTINRIAYQVADKSILKEVSFSVSEGERVTLVGPSGSGKSSLLRLLSSLISPTSGDIVFQGQSLKQLDLLSYRRQVSYCFQQPVLFGETVRDNMAFPFLIRQLDFDESRVLAYLEALGLTGAYLDQAIKDLSGGEKQRVALVRNLLFEALVHQLIDNYHQKGCTIIEVTHDKEEIETAHRLITIDKGEVVDDRRIGE